MKERERMEIDAQFMALYVVSHKLFEALLVLKPVIAKTLHEDLEAYSQELQADPTDLAAQHQASTLDALLALQSDALNQRASLASAREVLARLRKAPGAEKE